MKLVVLSFDSLKNIDLNTLFKLPNFAKLRSKVWLVENLKERTTFSISFDPLISQLAFVRIYPIKEAMHHLLDELLFKYYFIYVFAK